jgi:3-phosphoglycerate kinase
LGEKDFFTLDDVETNNKRVFLRVDINVPLDPSTASVLNRCLKTILQLLY